MFSFKAFTLKLNEKYKSLGKALETSIMSAVTKAFTFLNSKSEPLRNVRIRDSIEIYYVHRLEMSWDTVVCANIVFSVA